MTRTLHRSAGFAALLTIALFWLSTIIVELFGEPESILMVKTGIVWGLLILVPSLAVTGASGFSLGGRSGSPVVATKRRRMAVIALNGLLVLVPCAFFLYSRAAQGRFDSPFLVVQLVELSAGGLNMTLIGLNIRDGLRLSGRFRGNRPGPGHA